MLYKNIKQISFVVPYVGEKSVFISDADVPGLMFTTTKYGKPAAIYRNYRFNRHSSSRDDIELFVCVKWAKGCRASIKTYQRKLLSIKCNHNHPH